jgi:tetratricopeptide (TPR) repeat protein/transcriptional regulator with XRE-family HTH domain
MFGQLVSAHRRRAGLTQEDLAARTGLSVRSIRAVENGHVRRPRPSTVRLLTEAFGLAEDDRDTFRRAAGGGPAGVPSSGFDRPVPTQLPPGVPVFAGRGAELQVLDDRAGSIAAISGPGGIGKTWLAVHWSYRNLGRFPDGQLFVNLRGFDPSAEPLAPGAVVRGFLDALGVAPAAVPRDLDEQIGLYRSLVAGRQMLVVLDNARDSTHVAGLLPGSATCTVLVTSRDRLTGLVARHGASAVSLEVLDPAAARELLVRRLGPDRIDAEPDAVSGLVAACAGLPLALGIAAARAVVQPRLALAVISAELRDVATRLGALDGDDGHASLRVVLSWSYPMLTGPQARVFGLLGIGAGGDIGRDAAAALTGLPAADVGAHLRALERQSLLHQAAPGRWRMHDLVRLYAAERAAEAFPARERENARRRLVDHTLHTLQETDRILAPHRAPIDLPAPVPGGEPLSPADEAAALTWLDAEHQHVLALQRLAVEQGWDTAVWQLAWYLDTFHRRRGHRREQLEVWRAGLAAAERTGDPAVLARAHRLVGDAASRIGGHAEAIGHLERAARHAETAGDRAELARVSYALAGARQRSGDLETALVDGSRTLELYRQLELPARVADALNLVGFLLTGLGRLGEARTFLEASLDLSRRQRHRTAEEAVLDSLGSLAQQDGRHRDAADYYRRALALARELGDPYNAAGILERLGDSYAALGERDEALTTKHEALRLYQEQGRTDDATRVRADLGRCDYSGISSASRPRV